MDEIPLNPPPGSRWVLALLDAADEMLLWTGPVECERVKPGDSITFVPPTTLTVT